MSGKFTVSELYYRTAGRQDFGCSGFEIAARSRVCDLYRRCRHGREHLSECGGGIGARLAHIAFGVDFPSEVVDDLALDVVFFGGSEFCRAEKFFVPGIYHFI